MCLLGVALLDPKRSGGSPVSLHLFAQHRLLPATVCHLPAHSQGTSARGREPRHLLYLSDATTPPCSRALCPARAVRLRGHQNDLLSPGHGFVASQCFEFRLVSFVTCDCNGRRACGTILHWNERRLSYECAAWTRAQRTACEHFPPSYSVILHHSARCS
jgi:hypothetical protein